jgi:hypothetical protein
MERHYKTITVDGVYEYDGDMTADPSEIDIEIEYESVQKVLFECRETGQKETDVEIVIREVNWTGNIYSERENQLIQEWVDNNMELLTEELL